MPVAPLPLLVSVFVNDTDPPVRFMMSINRPLVLVLDSVPLYVIVPLAPSTRNAVPLGFVTEVFAENVKLPAEPLTISIAASPPLSVAVPLKL